MFPFLKGLALSFFIAAPPSGAGSADLIIAVCGAWQLTALARR